MTWKIVFREKLRLLNYRGKMSLPFKKVYKKNICTDVEKC